MPSASVAASGELASVAKLKNSVFSLMEPSSATVYFQIRWPSIWELSDTGEPFASVRYSVAPSGDRAIPLVRPILPSRRLASPAALQSHREPVDEAQSWPLKNRRPESERARSFGIPDNFHHESLQCTSQPKNPLFASPLCNFMTFPCPTSAMYTLPNSSHFMPLYAASGSSGTMLYHASPPEASSRRSLPITPRPTLFPDDELSLVP